MLDADAIIRNLGLRPHPEGGHYRETFRDTATDPEGRPASSAILFLLKAGEVSRWHRIDAVEIWHWHAGAPLELTISLAPRQHTPLVLGQDLAAGHHPQAIVPAHAWQMAVSRGAYTLVGCTVAPAFTFDRFELAAPNFEP